MHWKVQWKEQSKSENRHDKRDSSEGGKNKPKKVKNLMFCDVNACESVDRGKQCKIIQSRTLRCADVCKSEANWPEKAAETVFIFYFCSFVMRVWSRGAGFTPPSSLTRLWLVGGAALTCRASRAARSCSLIPDLKSVYHRLRSRPEQRLWSDLLLQAFP